MAKHKKSNTKSPKPSTPKSKAPVKPAKKPVKKPLKKSPTTALSNAQYTRLYEGATQARKRLRSMAKSGKYAGMDIPDPQKYRLSVLLERIEKGEKNANILREMRNLKPIAQAQMEPAQPDYITSSGYVIPAARYNKLKAALERANKNIITARNKLPEIAQDVMPSPFDISSVIDDIKSDEAITHKIDDLSVFKPSKLKIKPINDEGEAGTDAQVEYYKRILERENARRAKLREERGTFGKNQQFQRADDEADFLHDIDINSISSMNELHRKAITWDDPARLARANLFVSNYLTSIDKLEEYYLNHNMLNDTVREKLNQIRDLASQYMNHEEAITEISFDVPDAAIDVMYNYSGNISLDAIITVWQDHLPVQ